MDRYVKSLSFKKLWVGWLVCFNAEAQTEHFCVVKLADGPQFATTGPDPSQAGLGFGNCSCRSGCLSSMPKKRRP